MNVYLRFLVPAIAMLLFLSACSSAPENSITEPAPGPTDPLPAPEVVYSVTDELDMSARVGQRDVDRFTLGNSGEGDLEVSVSTSASWLEVSPLEAVVQSDALEDFIVTATCGGSPAVRNGIISLSTNDADEPTSSMEVTLTCSEPPASDFQIDLIFSGAGITPARELVFEQAAARWAEVVTNDLSDIDHVSQAEVDYFCGVGYSYAGPVDDVLIFARVEDIDGPDGIVGWAGACVLRAPNRYPYLGVMVFDAADLGHMETNGTFGAVILHEMGHVLDFNYYSWNMSGLVQKNETDCMEATEVEFKGTAARAEWAALGGDGNVPVEDNGLEGTACSHWKDDVFGNEVMTGYVDLDMPLSRLTIAAFDDIGYSVNYEVADDYSLPPSEPALRTQSFTRLLEVILPPRGIRQLDGTITPLGEVEPLILDLKLWERH